MPTEQELLARIEELESQLAVKKPNQGIEVGQEYHLSIGLAKVVKFYEEDGHNKVQSLLKNFDPRDGITVIESESRLCSMPIDTFKRLIFDFRLGQLAREQEKIAKAKGGQK